MQPSATPTHHAANTANEQPLFFSELIVIALGGALGACLRHSVSLVIAAAQLHFVFATAVANVVGSFLLGLFVGYRAPATRHPLIRPFLTIGVFGSFTTFSALAMDNRRLAAESSEITAAVHLGASVLSGLAAFVFAERLGLQRFGRRQR